MLSKLLQILSLVLLLTGVWLLAFGLRLKTTARPAQAHAPQSGAGGPPAGMQQHPALFWVGLGLITAGAGVALCVVLLV